MCGQWKLDQQDLDTYRANGLLKSPFSIDDGLLSKMRESLDRLLRGRTSIIIAHRLATVRRADEILVLEHGRITQR